MNEAPLLQWPESQFAPTSVLDYSDVGLFEWLREMGALPRRGTLTPLSPRSVAPAGVGDMWVGFGFSGVLTLF